MKDQQGGDGQRLSEGEDIELRALDFQRQPDEKGVAVYRATVDDDEAPAAPVYAVTVRVASPPNDKTAADFEAYLGQMRARFLVAPPVQVALPDEAVPD